MSIGPDEQKINQRLRDERLKRHWSQQELADKLGITVVSVKRWERNTNKPTPYFRLKLTTLFEKTAEELGLFDENEADEKTSSALETGEPEQSSVHNPVEQSEHNTDKSANDIVIPDTPVVESSFPRVDTKQASFDRRHLLKYLIPAGAGLAVLAGGLGGLWWMNNSVIHTVKGQQVTSVPQPLTLRRAMLFRKPLYVNDISWSPDGQRLACPLGDNTIQIVEADTGNIERVYRNHKGYVNCAQWAKDGKRIASASADTTVQIWNGLSGERLLTYQGHKKSVAYLAWSHDGTKIASSDRAGKIYVWDAFTGVVIASYTRHIGSVWSLRWAPDDSYIVSGGDDGLIQVWEAGSGKPSETFRFEPVSVSSSINEIDWSPQGNRISSAHGDGKVYIWDAITGTRMLTYSAHTDAVRTARWSPDGRYMVSGGVDKTLHLWDTVSGMTLQRVKRHTDDILEIGWSMNGSMIASAGKDSTVNIYEVRV